MGLSDKEIILLNFKYQTYLTYINIIWTVAISFFVAIISYIFINTERLSKNLSLLIILSLVLIFIEIGFISIHLWINSKKYNIERRIYNNE